MQILAYFQKFAIWIWRKTKFRVQGCFLYIYLALISFLYLFYMIYRTLRKLCRYHFSSHEPKKIHQLSTYNFKKFQCNFPNQHQFHHTTFKFFRQVLSCALNPALIQDESLNPEAMMRAKAILLQIISVGSYSQAKGIGFVRQNVCKFIAKMDNVREPSKEEVMLTQGAQRGLHLVLRTLIADRRDAVMIPSPNYPLHSEIIKLNEGTVAQYHLNESKGWDIDAQELQKCYANLVKNNKNPKAIIITNPGNPTGATLSQETIAKVLQFSVSHRLLVIADEVFRQNIPGINTVFRSFRSVLERLPQAIRENCELISINSISKGPTMTPGLRGGYLYLHNISPQVLGQLHKFQTLYGCSNIIGQLMIDLTVNPFECMSQATQMAFLEECIQFKSSVQRRGRAIWEALREMEGVSCEYISGSMYLYPSVRFSRRARAAAEDIGIPVDQFYCQRMQQNTGTALLPGIIFGQPPGTYHFRISSCLCSEQQLPIFLQKLKNSNFEFHRRYAE